MKHHANHCTYCPPSNPLYWLAMSRAVCPSLFTIDTCAPCSTSKRNNSTFPFFAALCNTVSPPRLFSVMSAPALRRMRVSSVFAFITAKCNGVFPLLTEMFTSACLVSSRLSISMFSLKILLWMGFIPCTALFTSAPCCRRMLTSLTLLFDTARFSRVVPRW